MGDGAGGLEPPQADPESAVLPLDDAPTYVGCCVSNTIGKSPSCQGVSAYAKALRAASSLARTLALPRTAMVSKRPGLKREPVSATLTG